MYRGFRSFRHFGRMFLPYRRYYYPRRSGCCCFMIPLALLLGVASIFALSAMLYWR